MKIGPVLKDVHPLVKKVDGHNERHEKHLDSEIEYITRDVAKSIWGHYRDKTFVVPSSYRKRP